MEFETSGVPPWTCSVARGFLVLERLGDIRDWQPNPYSEPPCVAITVAQGTLAKEILGGPTSITTREGRRVRVARAEVDHSIVVRRVE
jgi:hypothetical protein